MRHGRPAAVRAARPQPQGPPGQPLKPQEAHAIRYHSLHTNQYIRYFQGHTAQVGAAGCRPSLVAGLPARQRPQPATIDTRA